MDNLIALLIESWEWKYKPASFSYAIASFPWLDDKSNILLRPGLSDSFENMVREAESASAWGEKGCKAIWQVDITVYVEPGDGASVQERI